MRIRSYAGDDRMLGEIAGDLDASVAQFSERPMAADELKVAYYAAAMPLASRAPSGKARRS
jgi:hypothetical protein